MRWKELGEERCSIARTIAVIGDRWTLLILRDCFLRVRHFDGFEERLGVARHVLADRLKKLVAHGVLQKVPYQQSPVRYEYRLTEAGLDMYPLLTCLRYWGDRYAAERKGPPFLYQHVECGYTFDPVLTCSKCGQPIDPRSCPGFARPWCKCSAAPGYAETRVADSAQGLARHCQVNHGWLMDLDLGPPQPIASSYWALCNTPVVKRRSCITQPRDNPV